MTFERIGFEKMAAIYSKNNFLEIYVFSNSHAFENINSAYVNYEGKKLNGSKNFKTIMGCKKVLEGFVEVANLRDVEIKNHDCHFSFAKIPVGEKKKVLREFEKYFKNS